MVTKPHGRAWAPSIAACLRSGLRLALPSSAPSCTFPAEGKFSAWPGLPVAPEFPVFEEAAGREKGAVYSRASSREGEASPLCLSRCKMHPSCASGGEPGAPEGGGLQTTDTRLASAPPDPCPLDSLIPTCQTPLLHSPGPQLLRSTSLVGPLQSTHCEVGPAFPKAILASGSKVGG